MEFQVLLWKFEESSTAIRQFFVKKHSDVEKSSHKPEDRTLLVLNIPSYCDENALGNLFARFGFVEKVYIQKNSSSPSPLKSQSEFFNSSDGGPIKGYKVCYVVFRASKSIEKVLTFAGNTQEMLILSSVEQPVEVGLQALLQQQKRPLPSLVDLKNEIDAYMSAYDAKAEAQKVDLKQQEGVADDDGWVTVTRVGKKRGVRQEDVMSDSAGPEAKKKSSDKELLNFYRFQVHDGKSKQMSELRQKFEEDKQKVALMKASRKFKPF